MILDSSVIVAILTSEPDGVLFQRLLAEEADPVISAATLLESHIVMRRRLGEPGVEKVDRLLREGGVGVIPVDETQARSASRGHAAYGRGSGSPARLNYGDCFSYALAISRDEPLLFKGDDFIHTDVRRVELA
ncbi:MULTISPECIES: type II toxin-antitoxin system VapC family toxin [unclassified Microbacterium]|uniref:type II toxin-antitoxin system VapC family toxin n=1 Tax=unclassified Microbacterium TaxID=2609290 RepID=UPI00109C6428|nr:MULTISPECIES: type II toxin-antitoxin system VapC family toxin [unclassified Microbacterium]